MRTVCPGWSRPHAIPIRLDDDLKPDGLVSYGMCATCQIEYGLALTERDVLPVRVGRKAKP